MNDENELLEPLATEAGQEAIVRAIRDISSLEYAVRAEQAASQASAKAGEASQSALEASEAEDKAKDWATKTDTYVEQQIITIPPEQEGEEPTTETINLYSARYYAALAQDIYNNMSFDSVPTENSTNMVSSGTVYSALDLKADKSTTYTKTEVDTALSAKADQSTTYTKTEVDTQISTAVSNLVNSAPSTLDTLEELADALGDDPNFATTIATQLGNKADKSDTYTKTEVDTALSNVQSTLTFDNVPTANSDNPVKSSGIKTALDGKQDTLTFDSTPTANSTNPVTSGGIYTALQNVNIDIDDEITEDSDNPVTSAAIYEALQNFTPSGGGGSGAGNASGVVREELWGNINGWNSDTITLNTSWKDYDILEFVGARPSESPTSNNPYITENYLIVAQVKTQSIKYLLQNYDDRYMTISFTNDTTLTAGNNRDFKIYNIYGIKFSKNLSEQMYSNVLYENASGWSSGSITLSDSLENYDFIQCDYRNGSDPSQYINSNIFDAKLLLDGRLLSICGYDSRYFNITVTSSTVLTLLARGDYILTKITGYKLAKGGYSGIVSDARMTVKSGFVDLSSGVARDARHDYDIIFDYPMPDDNYVVRTEKCGWANFYNQFELTITNKTASGFTISGYLLNGNIPATQGFGISWIAIRPNSYTREGMVEDVLFSNASGVGLGTVNLSGNISDYDLIQFCIKSSGYGHSGVETILSNELVQFTEDSNVSNKHLLLSAYDNEYIRVAYVNDNTLKIWDLSGEKITKITGIKFGRYVSGVAVDTTVTQNSDAVITSGAVYDALQNYTPSGGGSGGSITIDNELISGSQNPVSGDGIVDAFDNILSNVQSATEFTCNSEYYFDEADELIAENGSSYNAYKSNNIPAIICMYNYDNWYNIRILSPIQNGTLYYGNTTANASGQYNDPNSGVTWYWSSFQVNKNYTNKNCPILDNGQSVAGMTGDQIVSRILSAAQPVFHVQKEVVLDSTPTENSTNLVTSGGVYAALQNIPSGSSVTVDSIITQGGTNPVEGGAIYTALGDKADKSTTYTKTEVDTALSSKGDVTTNTDQNITGTKTFVGSKKVGFKQSTANDKLGFTLYGNTGTERGYLEFNPTNTIDGVAGLMTLGNYATSAGALTHVGFRRYSNISGANGAYNLLTPLIADAKSPFSLTTTYTNFYLPLGFTDGTTTVKTAKSGLVDLSPLLASLESRIAALEGN